MSRAMAMTALINKLTSRSFVFLECSIYWLRVFRLIGLACKVLGLLILVLSPEPIYGPFFLGGQNDEK
jgi:hypothetical protein